MPKYRKNRVFRIIIISAEYSSADTEFRRTRFLKRNNKRTEIKRCAVISRAAKTHIDCTTQYFVVPKINRTKKVCVFTYKNTKRFIFVKILCGSYIIAQTFGFCKTFKLIFARFLNDLNINKTYICGGDSKPFRANFQCIFKKSL